MTEQVIILRCHKTGNVSTPQYWGVFA